MYFFTVKIRILLIMTGGTWGAKLSIPRVRRMWKAAMSNLLLDEDARGPRNVSLTDQILLERCF